MASDSSVKHSGGVSFCSLLLLLFVGLKLTGFINWSWWWVLSPFWIPLALCGVLLLVIGFCYIMAIITGQTKQRVRR
jgi:hypothetical protein